MRKTIALLALMALAQAAYASEPFNSNGDVGLTSYATLPFQTNVIQDACGSSAGLSPLELYYSSNSKSIYLNSSAMAAIKSCIASLENQGVVNLGGIQRWEDTWEISQAASLFPGEPSNIANDRKTTCSGYPGNSGGLCTGQPEFVAWMGWIKGHHQYWDLAWDGGTMPDYYRPWKSQWGHVDPITPLATTDCAPAPSPCKYGDKFAYQWGATSKLDGTYAVSLADFTDSLPQRPITQHNFNKSIIAAFGTYIGQTVPGTTVAAQAKWIIANKPLQWMDYTAIEYANFWSALAGRVGTQTGKVPLIVDQCGGPVEKRRQFGLDQRFVATSLSPHQYMCGWDDRSMEFGCSPQSCWVLQALTSEVMASAREPLIRNGATLMSDNGDSDFRSVIASSYPTLSAAAKTEIGTKLLRRVWVWNALAHIADRNGVTRRALAYTSRDDFDGGSITSIDPVTSVIQSVVPTHPFGAAIYYSDATARAYHLASLVAAGSGGIPSGWYLDTPTVQSFIEGGAAVGYYVSDAALPNIIKGSANAPFAWLVIDPKNLMTAAEKSSLSAIAPVVTSVAALNGLPSNPLSLPSGMSGFGFYDQAGNLVLVLTNTSVAPGAAPVSGNIKLNGTGFIDGPHSWKSLLTGASGAITISNGGGSLPETITRWDTDIISIGP